MRGRLIADLLALRRAPFWARLMFFLHAGQMVIACSFDVF